MPDRDAALLLEIETAIGYRASSRALTSRPS